MSRREEHQVDSGSTPIEGLVSVIVPTKNSARFLRRCLESVRAQTYPDIEVIIVDNGSTDETWRIATELADTVVPGGPERSAQVNQGAALARGEWVYRVDSDFELEPAVVAECVTLARAGHDAIVVHNSPDISAGRLARIRRFEVDMYKFNLDHSAARFVDSALFHRIGGYDEAITAGEDYDFQNRLTRAGARFAFADAEAIHLDEPTRLTPQLLKYYAYGKDVRRFKRANPETRQFAFARPVYLLNWRRFRDQPVLGAQFVAYHLLKFGAGGIGYFVAGASARARRTTTY
jgi:glycosyltransferase involved in cell wall biosynthesis